MNNINEFSRKYLLKRCSMDAIPPIPQRVSAGGGSISGPQASVNKMLKAVEETTNRLFHDKEKFDEYQAQLFGLLDKASFDVQVVKKMSKHDVICSFLGVTEPTEITVECPTPSSNKGHIHYKSKGEIAASKKRKSGNECTVCKQGGHTLRSCKNEPINTPPR